MRSLLCNFLVDWGVSIKNSIGETGVIICLVLFTCLAFALFANMCVDAVKKVNKDKKFKIFWFRLIFLVIVILFAVWFATIL